MEGSSTQFWGAHLLTDFGCFGYRKIEGRFVYFKRHIKHSLTHAQITNGYSQDSGYRPSSFFTTKSIPPFIRRRVGDIHSNSHRPPQAHSTPCIPTVHMVMKRNGRKHPKGFLLLLA